MGGVVLNHLKKEKSDSLVLFCLVLRNEELGMSKSFTFVDLAIIV